MGSRRTGAGRRDEGSLRGDLGLPHPPEGIEGVGCRFSISHYTYEKTKVNHRRPDRQGQDRLTDPQVGLLHTAQRGHTPQTHPTPSLLSPSWAREVPPTQQGRGVSVKSSSGTQESRSPQGTQLWTHKTTSQESSSLLALECGHGIHYPGPQQRLQSVQSSLLPVSPHPQRAS